MPTNPELRIMQTDKLFDLIQLEKDNEGKGFEITGLKRMIIKTKATMTQEEVAWVEKKIEELYR